MRYRRAELAARLLIDPTVFSLPREWALHAGIRACLSRAQPLRSQDGGEWRCCGRALDAAHLLDAAQRVSAKRTAAQSVVKGRGRAT